MLFLYRHHYHLSKAKSFQSKEDSVTFSACLNDWTRNTFCMDV